MVLVASVWFVLVLSGAGGTAADRPGDGALAGDQAAVAEVVAEPSAGCATRSTGSRPAGGGLSRLSRSSPA